MATLLPRTNRSFLPSLRPHVNGSRLQTCYYSSESNLPKPRLDYRTISEQAAYKSHNVLNRKSLLPVEAVQSIPHLYEQFKQLSATLNDRRNARSAIGDRIRKSSQDKDTRAVQDVLEDAKKLKQELIEHERQVSELEEKLHTIALAIPNDTHPDSPVGPASSAVILSTHGPVPTPPSPIRDHVDVGRELSLLEFDAGSTVTGSSWYYLMNEAALLEVALINYALSIAIKHGFTPITTPDVIRADIASRCGFQPRDQSDSLLSQMYSVATSSNPSAPELVLAGTAEIPLAGMFANRIYPETSLPIKVVGLGHAFRAEAGARGHDTRGLYRVHQFTKLELFAVTANDASYEMMEFMKQVQVEILEGLGFPFKIFDMPTEELGSSAYRKYDAEAWMPGRGSWGEVSSLSNCTDYQARRLHIRYRPSQVDQSPLPFAHTLNGTAVAIPRVIVALLENGVRLGANGKVVGLNLPESLQSFWVGGSGSGVVEWVQTG